jgi:hypothetical protein
MVFYRTFTFVCSGLLWLNGVLVGSDQYPAEPAPAKDLTKGKAEKEWP